MKIAVFYYTQTGQALEAAKSVCRPIEEADDGSHVICKEIVPLTPYPFPWSRHAFFDVFPETRLGITPSAGIRSIDFSDIADADLVMVVGQSWFLSPSQPLQSFFTDRQVMHYLSGRDVIFVNVCRNMWVMTIRKVKAYISEAGARLAGHIVLQDRASNLVSVVTIIRWLIYGKKDASRCLSKAGVSDKDILFAARFGDVIRQTFKAGKLSRLQERLLQAGAIDYKPSVVFMEKTGHRMFGLWARFVRRRGGQGDPRRRRRLDIFYAYLLFVLFAVSPIGQAVFWLTWPLHKGGGSRHKDCGV